MNFLILIFVVFVPLFAQDFNFDKEKGISVPNFVAEIKLFKGKVYKLIAGEQKEVQVGTRFFKNERLVTKEKSFVKVEIVDDTNMSLGPNSELNFEEFKFVDKNDRAITYALLKGQLAANIKRRAKKDNIVVKTKNAVMGVRGTRILVNAHSLDEVEVSEFALLSGSAQITDSKKQQTAIIKGDKVVLFDRIADGGAVNKKAAMSEDEFNHLDAADINEEREFRPFLPFYVPEKNKDPSLYGFLDKQTANNPSPRTSGKEDEGPKKGSLYNLEKLNEQLKENQE